MKRIERLLIKLAFLHFVLLLITQIVFHGLDFLPELNKLAFYEGVNKQEHTEIIDVLNSQKDLGSERD
ncbi:YpfB family protein [Bacillus salacetis]|uniref:YpfB family protein n=1 Tax=Bacillus salacetis TaxID=2315464 RepID=UPI003BA01A33